MQEIISKNLFNPLNYYYKTSNTVRDQSNSSKLFYKTEEYSGRNSPSTIYD